MSKLRLAPLFAIACSAAQTMKAPAAADRGVALPVTLENDRWFLDTTTATGAKLRIYLDSAGGLFLAKTAVARLGLPVTHTKSDDGESDLVTFPKLADTRIPMPTAEQFAVLDEDCCDDGMFGAPWFGGQTIAFDYPAKRMIARESGDLPAVASEHRIPVAFPLDAQGAPKSPYGRIQMIVDGETIDMLLDTGATVDLTDSALAVLGGTAHQRATCFITKTVFDRWHAAHPTWRVIESADREIKQQPAPLIEVPELIVAGYKVGPVWFTWRSDYSFHGFMASMMDKVTEGALGGSAFNTFRITVDWKRGVAAFER